MILPYLINLYIRYTCIICYIIRFDNSSGKVGPLARVHKLKASVTLLEFPQEKQVRVLAHHVNCQVCKGAPHIPLHSVLSKHRPVAIKGSQSVKLCHLCCQDLWRPSPPDHQFPLTNHVRFCPSPHSQNLGGRKWLLCIHLCPTSLIAWGEVSRTAPGPAAWAGVEKCWIIKLPISAQLL
jgi:hypothetical protein